MTNNALVPLPDAPRTPADVNPAVVYIGRLRSKRSRDTMREALNIIARLITNGEENAIQFGAEWGELRYQHTAMIRTWLSERYKPGTVNKMLSALRGVLKEAWRLGYMTADEYGRARDIPNIRNDALPVGRDLTEGEIRALMQICEDDPTPAGVRDAALFGVLWVALRRAEVAGLQVGDYEPETGKLTVVHGKGDKPRELFLDTGAMSAMAHWLAIRGNAPGALFVRINKSGKLHAAGMTPQSIYHIVMRRGKQAGIENFTVHDFRRTAVGDYLGAGVDIVTVQKILGHANVTTTARYDRRGNEEKRAAAQTRRLPYKGRG